MARGKDIRPEPVKIYGAPAIRARRSIIEIGQKKAAIE